MTWLNVFLIDNDVFIYNKTLLIGQLYSPSNELIFNLKRKKGKVQEANSVNSVKYLLLSDFFYIPF